MCALYIVSTDCRHTGGGGHNLCAAYKILIWCVPEDKFPDFRITCFDETCRIFCFIPKKIEDDVIQMFHAIVNIYKNINHRGEHTRTEIVVNFTTPLLVYLQELNYNASKIVYQTYF